MNHQLSVFHIIMLLFLIHKTCNAQDVPLTGIEFDAGLSVLTVAPAQHVFPVAFNINGGPKWTVGEDNRLWIKATVGAQIGMHDLPDNYTEYLLMAGFGPEVQYDAYYTGNITFFPYYKANVVYTSNFDTLTDEEESNGETYLTGWGFSQETGMKIQFGTKWYIRLGYQFFSPRLNVKNHQFQGDLGKGLEEKNYKTFNLSTATGSVGFNLNFL